MLQFWFLAVQTNKLRLVKSSNINFKVDYLLVVALFFVSCFISSDSLVDKTLTSRYLGAFSVLLAGFFITTKRAQSYLNTQIRWLDIFLFAYCFWQVLSVFWATNTAEALSSSFRSIAMFMAYFFLRVLLVSDRRWKDQLLLVVSVASSAYLLVLWYTLVKVTEGIGLDAQSIYLVRYPTETKNLTSIFLLVSMTFQILLAIENRNWKRWFGLANTTLMLGTLFLLSTRGISLSIIAMGAAVLLLQLVWKQHRFKYGLVLGLALVILGTGHWLASNKLKESSSQVYKSQTESLAEEQSEDSPEHTYRSANERLGLWKKTIGLIKQNPILGVGAGNWQIEYPRNGLDGLERAQFRTTSFKRPHNEALSILCETGIIGLILFVLILLRFFQNGLNRNKSDLLITAAMVGLITASMFDFPRERMEHNLLFAVMLALTVSEKPLVKLDRTKTRFIFFGLLAITTFGILVYWMRFDGERQYDKLRRLKAQNKYSECIQHAQRVENPFYTVDWINYPIAWFTGVCYSYQGQFVEAEKEFARALPLNPGNFHTHNNLGFCLAQQEKYEKAIPYFESCLAINSKFEEARFNLAFSLIKMNKLDEAIEALSTNITDSTKRNVYLNEIEKLKP